MSALSFCKLTLQSINDTYSDEKWLHPLWLQCRHIISALNTWAARAEYTTARLPPNWCNWCMDDLTTEKSSRLQVMWVIDVIILTCYHLFWCLYSRLFADIRSTGAGIKCLHSTNISRKCGQRNIVAAASRRSCDYYFCDVLSSYTLRRGAPLCCHADYSWWCT